MQTNAKSYSRTEKHDCTVVSGQLPLRDMATLLQQAAPDSIMDPQAANMLGPPWCSAHRRILPNSRPTQR